MVKIAKKTKRYPSDLTDEEWDRIAPLMPQPNRTGRPREVDFREVINAVCYLVRSGCGWRMLMDKATYLDFIVEIVRTSEQQKGFAVLPQRWVVERTLGWMMRWRRLTRDYERRIDVPTAMILVAMGGILIRRNAHP